MSNWVFIITDNKIKYKYAQELVYFRFSVRE